MRIEENDIGSSRSALALELMIEGKESLQFSILAINNKYTVVVTSTWNIDNLNEAKAIENLEQGRALFTQLCKHWPQLENYFSNTSPYFELVDDYGMGAALVVSSPRVNEYEWHIKVAT